MAVVLLMISDAMTSDLLERGLQGAGFEALLPDKAVWSGTQTALLPADRQPDVALVDEAALSLRVLKDYVQANPQVPLVLFTAEITQPVLLQAMRLGVVGVLTPPVRYEALVNALRAALERREAIRKWALEESRRKTHTLQTQIDELKTLLKVGQALTSELNLEAVLTAVASAAVEFTGAEESTLFLLDEKTGELYLRASHDFSGATNALRLQVDDTLAGQVLRTGNPLLLDSDTLQKIKTSYLVHALIYVPLSIHGRVIGVLGVDNRTRRGNFTSRHVERLTALAEYAAVALENAQLFTEVQTERKKLTSVMRSIKEGIVIIDTMGEIMLINRVAQMVLDVSDAVLGESYRSCCPHPDLREGIRQGLEGHEYHTEINAADGRVFSVRVTPVPQVGAAVTMHDVTHFKELDRLKSDFVSTVSHDLRSPLTSILGYVDLLERAGPLTPMQKRFVDRVRSSVENITALINDLLDLGRIEAGFDTEKEVVSIAEIVRYAVEGIKPQAEAKRQELVLRMGENIPLVLGNIVRLRQMLDNIIGNAVKYTGEGGRIEVTVENHNNQVVIRVSDNGPGIPPSEQPYIFNKFFRASNVASEKPGTGLGLAIVKSIVEAHHGRVWVESEVGKGTTFTVVLPGLEGSAPLEV